jgi:KUP system potassium uptake protein
VKKLENSIVPLSIAILVLLVSARRYYAYIAQFLLQTIGTRRISLLFAPIVGLWFTALFVTGIINISTNDPAIFRAYNPGQAIRFLVRRGDLSVLGGVFLAVTGIEATFADMGHYTRRSIQWTFAFVVYPTLIVNYLGQAAALENHPEWISNTFYNSIPCGPGSAVYWVVFVLAVLATIIASQAMIFAAFSIATPLTTPELTKID